VLTGAAGPIWEDLQLWISTKETVEEMESGLAALPPG
jgi:hypothetical protein